MRHAPGSLFWRMQMAQLQRHQEPSSQEIDPSCKIIRLLIAPAPSYPPWIQARFHHFPSALPFSPPPRLGSGWCWFACREGRAAEPGWRETEPAHEFWTADKSREGSVGSSPSAQSQGSQTGVCPSSWLGAARLLRTHSGVPFSGSQLLLSP